MVVVVVSWMDMLARGLAHDGARVRHHDGARDGAEVVDGSTDVSRSPGRCPGNRDTPAKFYWVRDSGHTRYRLKGNGVTFPASHQAFQTEVAVRDAKR